MMNKFNILSVFLVLVQINAVFACKCYIPPEEPIEPVIKSPLPHTYLKTEELPAKWDWRNVNGTNYCGKVLTQMSPAVCGSCWAEAATGALSDRYTIATQGKLRVTLATQQLLNFNKIITGGSCNGGSDQGAYKFIHNYGIADDTCAVFVGHDWAHGCYVAAYKDYDDVRAHQCYLCNWGGDCAFVPSNLFDTYGVDEYGTVSGVENMKAEIYARGPISCLVNAASNSFNEYQSGIITCDAKLDVYCKGPAVDHVIVVAGWGKDDVTGQEYWVGRNSYGSRWGEGAGGGWFRVALGDNVLNIETGGCGWATPAQTDVDRAVKQFNDAAGI